MNTNVCKVEICSVCGGGGDLFTPDEHDAGAQPMQVSLRTMLLQVNNHQVVPEGRLCVSCIRRTIEAYEFSTALGSKTTPRLTEKVRILRRKLHDLTQKVDVFILMGGPGLNSEGACSEDDIIIVDRDALAAAVAIDDDDALEKARNASGDSVYQCTICPKSFQLALEYRSHVASHPSSAHHSCWTCGAQFTQRDALNDHVAVHTTDGLTCQLCQSIFQSASQLGRHESDASCPSRCPVPGCGVRYMSRSSLSSHASEAHSREPPMLCPQCFMQCSTRAQMSAHALSHRCADRFVCGYDACMVRFANRGDLLSHIRNMHSGSIPEPTSEQPPSTTCHCGRVFGSVSALKRHSHVHRREIQQEEDSDWKVTMEIGEESEEVEGMLEGDVEYLELDTFDEYDD